MVDGTQRPTGYLLTEGGYGAYNELLQGLGGYMRVAAARWGETAVDPNLAADYERDRREVLAPWYGRAKQLVLGIVGLYADGTAGYGYVPEIENSLCAGTTGPLTWRASGRSVELAAAHRATWYGFAALWYWWYESDWMAVGD